MLNNVLAWAWRIATCTVEISDEMRHDTKVGMDEGIDVVRVRVVKRGALAVEATNHVRYCTHTQHVLLSFPQFLLKEKWCDELEL
mmetsp:Transcript_8895/g.24176  ORF Transcript_8895/g.24176 Transcript_8895/m.24176 type:complete len:85 (-) Transcript_8895:1488-1742(-)